MLKDSLNGLSEKQAKRRLKKFGFNTLIPKKRFLMFHLFLGQFINPLILLLLSCALLSFFLSDGPDAIIILLIVFISGMISFFQEKGAIKSINSLLKRVSTSVTVIRDGQIKELVKEVIVPGDLIFLKAGDLIPADAYIIESHHLFVDEAIFTGESSPVEKITQMDLSHLSNDKNCNLYTSTMVTSGFAKAIVTKTGLNTEYSQIIQKIKTKPIETSFERGIKNLSYLILDVTIILVLVIFLLNIFLKKPVLESFLFSLALSIGLVPQLLPAVISVNLSYGAKKMAEENVIVKYLPTLENFGIMNILCTDKTGTITTGKMVVKSIVDLEEKICKKAEEFTYLNAYFQTAYKNPIDDAILSSMKYSLDSWRKIDEIPYDFQRKRISTILDNQNTQIIITKGALEQILSICSFIEFSDGRIENIQSHLPQIRKQYELASSEGMKTLAICYQNHFEEKEMIFLGLIEFFDPLKPMIHEEINQLQAQGISLKILTGDHHLVAIQTAKNLGLKTTSILTGAEIDKIDDRALTKIAEEKTVFAEIEPNQKERIVLALKRAGHTVGFIGDGINDVPAIFAADIGISVDTATDAAKESADIVLLKQDLSVLSKGVTLGRKSFLNTIKYLQMATSANFGNMLSMAIISIFIPFIPLLPKQVLLINFLSDFPEMALATDHVDDCQIKKPLPFDQKFLKHFMIIFGLISSIADFLTFLSLWILQVDRTIFRTAWFTESVLSATIIILVIRSQKIFFRSRPSNLLISLCAGIIIFTLSIPYIGIGKFLNFTPLPPKLYGLIFLIIVLYIIFVEVAKYFFFNKFSKKIEKNEFQTDNDN